MKSVVMIAYNFPPEGNAGTYRPLRFVRYLPALGWRPTVIAEAPDRYERYDPGLLKLVPEGTEIVRVRNRDPWKLVQDRRLRRFVNKTSSLSVEKVAEINATHRRPLRSLLREGVRQMEAFVYHPDTAVFWIGAATNAAVKACRRNGSVVLWATGGPWSSFIVARNASRRTALPYVIDLRDSWTLSYDELQQRQSERAKVRDRKLLGTLMRDAQAVVFRYLAEAESYYRAYPSVLDPRKVHLIPNGYDGSVAPFDVPKGERCLVLYTGVIGTYIYESLLEALAALKKSEPETAGKLRFVFVGEDTELIANLAAQLDLKDIVESARPVGFSEVSRLQSEAHALLLFGWRPQPGSEFGGSKIFGYLKAGRPIIGVLPRDENRRTLSSVGVSTIADAGSLPEITGLLRKLVDAWSADKLTALLPDREACGKYSAERQTQALARALEGAPALDPFVPGTSSVAPSLVDLIASFETSLPG